MKTIQKALFQQDYGYGTKIIELHDGSRLNITNQIKTKDTSQLKNHPSDSQFKSNLEKITKPVDAHFKILLKIYINTQM